MTTVPHPPYSPDLTQTHYFLFLQMKNVLKGKEEMKQTDKKNGRNTKRHQNQWVQKLFYAREKNVLIGVLHHMESTLKVTEV